MEELFEQVAGVAAKHSRLPACQISPKSRLYADLRMDSLDIFALMMDIETTFNIVLPGFRKLRTVSDILNLMSNLEFRV